MITITVKLETIIMWFKFLSDGMADAITGCSTSCKIIITLLNMTLHTVTQWRVNKFCYHNSEE